MTRPDERTPGRPPSSLLPRLILFGLTILVAGATVGATRADRWLVEGRTYQSCESEAGAEYQFTNAVIFDVVTVPGFAPFPQVPDAHRAALNRWVERRCGSRPVHSPERPAAAAVAGVLLGGFLLYWLIPYWRIRTRRLIRIGEGRDDGRYGSAAGHEVHRLAAAAGVTLHRVWLHPTDYSDNAVAFGHWRRRAIEIKSGMVSLHRRDPAAFRAIVGHELGHLRHRDVDAAYAMTGLWQAFLALSVTVTVTGGVGDELGNSSLEAALATAARLGALVLAVYLARNGMLRAREFHADAFAATIDGGSARSALERLLARRQQRWDAGPDGARPAARPDRRRPTCSGTERGPGCREIDEAARPPSSAVAAPTDSWRAVLAAVLAGRELLRLLSAGSGQTPYALIVVVGLLIALTNVVKAAAAADEDQFAQQIVYGRNWLTLTGVVAVGGLLIGLPWRTEAADDDVPRLVAVVLITGVLAGIGFIGRETAADVYSYRHRRRARTAEPVTTR